MVCLPEKTALAAQPSTTARFRPPKMRGNHGCAAPMAAQHRRCGCAGWVRPRGANPSSLESCATHCRNGSAMTCSAPSPVAWNCSKAISGARCTRVISRCWWAAIARPWRCNGNSNGAASRRALAGEAISGRARRPPASASGSRALSAREIAAQQPPWPSPAWAASSPLS